jgi:hypothetical protein
MPLGYLAAGQASGDANFLARVQAYLMLACDNITSEATSQANHYLRIALVKRIKGDPSGWAARFAPSIAMQAGPQTAGTLAAVTDSQIQVATDSVFDNFAFTLVP